MRQAGSNPRRGGFTLIESVICIVIVAGLIVAALSALGASARVQNQALLRSWAQVLAEDLLTEILVLPYDDPETPGAGLGPDGAEDDGTRANFDDVDDFDSWAAPDPEAPDGTLLDLPEGFKRMVGVEYVDPANLLDVVGSDLGVKRVRIIIEFNDMDLIVVDAYRTSAWSVPWEGGS